VLAIILVSFAFMLPAPAVGGAVVDEWGASRIIAAHLRGDPSGKIATDFTTSVSTVGRIIDHYKRSGNIRKPRQGQGKRDDPRWVFSGPRGPKNVLLLEKAFNAGTADSLLRETHDRLSMDQADLPAYSTMTGALRVHLDITGKRLTGQAIERDPQRCADWITRVRQTYTTEQLILIDETHSDDKVANRRFGRSRRGTRAKGVVMFHKGKRFSALGVFTLDGMLDCHITEDGYDAFKFRCAFRKKVLPYLRPYPERHSVLVLDNCPNLHTQLTILDMVHDVGARVEFLEPYDPHHMPIEIAFRCAKMFLRLERKELACMPRRERLRHVLMRVGHDAARNAFRECGYEV